MFDGIPTGKVIKGTDDYKKMCKIARVHLDAIQRRSGSGLIAKLSRHVSFSALNTLLSFYGWAIRRNGSMLEVWVRNDPANSNCSEVPVPIPGSIAEINEKARKWYISSGKLADPRTGREIPYHERHRFGIL